MDYPVRHQRFQNQKLALRRKGHFGGGTIVLNNEPVQGKRGKFMLSDDNGQQVDVKIKQNLFDPIPQVIVGEDIVRVIEPLKPIEYIWGWAPVILVFIGGFLGGLLGGGAGYINMFIFRSQMSKPAKYALTALITVTAVVVFFILAIVLTIFLQGLKG